MAASSLTSDDDDGEINTATVFGNTKTTQHNKLNKCLVKSNLILIVNRTRWWKTEHKLTGLP